MSANRKFTQTKKEETICVVIPLTEDQMVKSWQQSEEKAARARGLKRTLASGSRPGFKGDASSTWEVNENKWTGKEYFTLHAEWLKKAWLTAMGSGKKPSFTFEIMGAGHWEMMPLQFVDDEKALSSQLIRLNETKRIGVKWLENNTPCRIETGTAIWILRSMAPLSSSKTKP